MPLYRVVIEDLNDVQAALTTQADGLATTQAQTTQSVTQLGDLTVQALTTGRTTVAEHLETLATEVNRSNERATTAQWPVPATERFRQRHAERRTAIDQTSTRFTEAVTTYEAATTALMTVLDEVIAEFTAATQASQESSTQLGSAVQIEAQSYEVAFNGSFA